jgi:formylglycine-generating enzyme required for sulfatase activity
VDGKEVARLEAVGKKSVSIGPGKHVVKVIDLDDGTVSWSWDIEVESGAQKSIRVEVIPDRGWIKVKTKAKRSEAEKARLAEAERLREAQRSAPPQKGMVYVPAGEFGMGSPSEEGTDDERPPHTVYLDAYYVDTYEVTVGQYRAFAQATGRGMPEAPSWGWLDKHPVVNVTWEDADAYCRWAGKRLPTEAEWEKAARGTDGRRYPFGNFEYPFSGCLNFANFVGKTTPVGSYPNWASPYGAMDMGGNVAEWCSDWYDAGYYGDSPKANPGGPNRGTYRVLRGGSFLNHSPGVRAANRHWSVPDIRDESIGFRCSKTP